MSSYQGAMPDVSSYRKRRGRLPETEEDGEDRAKHYLHSGQYFVGDEATEVTTILGSCVAVCLWQADLGIGGINHFLLPSWAGSGRASPRFGNVAISSLIEAMLSRGCAASELEAKIFGGATVLSRGAQETESRGLRNIALARAMLASEIIEIVKEDVGGARGRKLIYHTDDGTAWIRKI